jgi:hypothetical protein
MCHVKFIDVHTLNVMQLWLLMNSLEKRDDLSTRQESDAGFRLKRESDAGSIVEV